jgi:hypothetical protein
MLAWRGSHPYGVAFAALKRGLKVHLIREKKTFWKDTKFPENNDSIRYSIVGHEKKSKALGLVESMKRKIDLKMLRELLEKNATIIILMKFIRKNGTIGSSHWVVPLKLEKKHIVIHDPYASGNRRIPIKLFMKGWNRIRDRKYGMNKEILIIKK